MPTIRALLCSQPCSSLLRTEVNAKEEYADAVAQERFDNGVMRGLPYEAALADAQKAMESAERHFEEVRGKEKSKGDKSLVGCTGPNIV